jgi:hypothetical protein
MGTPSIVVTKIHAQRTDVTRSRAASTKVLRGASRMEMPEFLMQVSLMRVAPTQAPPTQALVAAMREARRTPLTRYSVVAVAIRAQADLLYLYF